MPKKRFGAEQIVTLLRQIEVSMAQGKSARRPAGIRAYRSRIKRRMPQSGNLLQLERSAVVIEQWRRHYNTIRPHSALNYRPPAPQTFASLARHLDEIMPMQ